MISELEGRLIINRKPVKNYSIRIKPPGIVIITSPLRATSESIEQLLVEKRKWLEQHLSGMILKQQEHQELFSHNMVYLGIIYPIIVVVNNIRQKEKITMTNGKCLIFLNHLQDTDKQKELLDKWYLKQAKTLFAELITKYQPFIPVMVKHLSVRKMNTRWGSCNSTKQYINLNVDLIMQAVEAIEYVVLHELAHLVHPHHGQEFYALIASFMPDWKTRQQKLTKYHF